MAALALLAVWIWRRKIPTIVVSCILLSIIFAPVQAQSASRRECAKAWFEDHGSGQSGPSRRIRLLGRLQSRSNNRIIQTCDEASSILDALRFASVEAGKEDSAAGFSAYLAKMEEELTHSGLGFSSVVDAVIKLMDPWNRPFGTLEVKAKTGRCHILLNGDQVGFTNWIPPPRTRRL